MNSGQYFLQGLSLLRTKNYTSAIDSFQHAISEIDYAYQDNINSLYTYKAIAHMHLEQYKDALYNYKKALDPNYPISSVTYYELGIFWALLLDLNNAVQAFSKAIEFSDNHALAYFCRGSVYMELKMYDNAEKDYCRAMNQLNYLPPTALFFNALGNVQYWLGKYSEAIKYYGQAIQTDNNFIAAYNNRGNAYIKLNKQELAIQDYKKALTLNPFMEERYVWQTIFDVILPKFVDDVETYFKSMKLWNTSDEEFLIQILSLMNANREDYNDILYYFFNTNSDFAEVVKCDIRNKKQYIYIFARMLKILSLLNIKVKSEKISHYTSVEVAKALLFMNSPLRFSNIINTNDQYEGLIMKTLFGLKQNERSSNNAYIAYFVIGDDDNNMFRLYGKTDNIENSGLCLAFDKDFFNEQLSFSAIYDRDSKEKAPLFRCIYVQYNPEYKNEDICVSSIGGDSNDIKDEVQIHLNRIKSILSDNADLKATIVDKLLLPLKYLIKVDSWKAERECRILKMIICGNKCKDKEEQEYVNYLSIPTHVKKVVIGCNTFANAKSEHEFKENIENAIPDLQCVLSRHSNRIKKNY